MADPRIEAAARALNVEGWTCYDGNDEPGNYDECADCKDACDKLATAALAAADKAATITTREEFDALPKSATILGKAGDAFQWGTDFDDVTQGWYMAGSNTPTPIRALMTFGPFTVIHWGTE